MIPSSACPSWRPDQSGPAGDHDGAAIEVTPRVGTRSDCFPLPLQRVRFWEGGQRGESTRLYLSEGLLVGAGSTSRAALDWHPAPAPASGFSPGGRRPDALAEAPRWPRSGFFGSWLPKPSAAGGASAGFSGEANDCWVPRHGHHLSRKGLGSFPISVPIQIAPQPAHLACA